MKIPIQIPLSILQLKKIVLSFFIISALTLSFGCRKKTIPMDKMPDSQLIFGNGGGFTGEITEYHLLSDGRIVYKSLNDTIYNVLSRIGKSKATACFEDSKKMKLNTMKFSEPGNRYFFIAVKEAGKPENRIVWGDAEQPVLDEIKNFYKTLMAYLPNERTKEKEKEKQ
jgi:hypothetical protein